MAETKSKEAPSAADTNPIAPGDAPSTTEESDKQVADTQAKAAKETQAASAEVYDAALERGFLGTESEAGRQAAEYANLSDGAGYMGGPPKGEIVEE
jgi:hypothetical protein